MPNHERHITMQIFSKVPDYLVVAAAGWMARAVTAVTQLLSLRLLITYLGIDEYAAYSILVSATAWFLLADMGAGSALQNQISIQRANQSGWRLQYLFALKIATIFGLVTISIMAMFSPMIESKLLSNIVSESNIRTGYLFLIVAGTGVLQAIGSLQYRIWYGEHKGYYANVMPAFSSIISLAGLYATTALELSDVNKLIVAVSIYTIPQAMIPLIALYMNQKHANNTSGTESEVIDQSGFAKKSLGFFYFGLMASATLQIEYFVMSQTTSPDEIAQYAVVAKLFGLVFFVYNAILLAAWPICSEALAIRDDQKVISFTKRMLPIGFAILSISAILFLLFKNEISDLLSPKSSIRITDSVIVAASLYFLVRIWTDTFAMLLQSAGALKIFFYAVPLQAALTITFQNLLIPKYGAVGVFAALAITFILTVSWMLPVKFNQILKVKS